MHVITRKRIQEFIAQHPDSQSSLESWYRIMAHTDYNTFNELKRHFASADDVNNLVVFNISGNKYRLIAAIHFNRKKVFIREILTHAEYDKSKWRQ
ncbi:MAG: type II toxin-antitoxin system HigB family toxin [Anaerolineae bacterium]